MLSMTSYVHKRMSTYSHIDVAIDFTMGKGSDTEYLLSIAKEVYAFDIQQEAIDITSKKVGDKAHLILDSHENFDTYVSSFDMGVFNLGYLPCGDETITTHLESTKASVVKAVEKMNKVLFIVLYIGHSEGAKEAKWVEEYASKLDHRLYNVSMYKMLNKEKAPYVIEIEKR